MYLIKYYHDRYNEKSNYKQISIYASDSKEVFQKLLNIHKTDFEAENLSIYDLNQPLKNRSAGCFQEIYYGNFIPNHL